MSSEIIIAEWSKNGRETMRVRIDSFKDQAVIDCRAWYSGNDGLLRPGRGGGPAGSRGIHDSGECGRQEEGSPIIACFAYCTARLRAAA